MLMSFSDLNNLNISNSVTSEVLFVSKENIDLNGSSAFGAFEKKNNLINGPVYSFQHSSSVS